jgi:hypothetical protein
MAKQRGTTQEVNGAFFRGIYRGKSLRDICFRHFKNPVSKITEGGYQESAAHLI